MPALRMGFLTAVFAFATTAVVVSAMVLRSPGVAGMSQQVGSINWSTMMLSPVPTVLGFFGGLLAGVMLEAIKASALESQSAGASREERPAQLGGQEWDC